MDIAGRILASLSGYFKSSTDAGDMMLSLPGTLGTFTRTLQSGTGITLGNCDTMFGDTRTLNTAAENLDLIGGGLLTPALTTFAPARLKAIMVRCNGATAGNTVKIGGNVNGVPFLDDVSAAIIVPNGGWIVLVAPGDGWVVTTGTGDIITVETNYAGTYDIVLIGATA